MCVVGRGVGVSKQFIWKVGMDPKCDTQILLSQDRRGFYNYGVCFTDTRGPGESVLGGGKAGAEQRGKGKRCK